MWLWLQEAYRLQWQGFLGLVYEQRHLPSVKALLKLYSSISLAKLASLLDGLDEAAVRGQLILLKVCGTKPTSQPCKSRRGRTGWLRLKVISAVSDPSGAARSPVLIGELLAHLVEGRQTTPEMCDSAKIVITLPNSRRYRAPPVNVAYMPHDLSLTFQRP